jgi:hypothetical protein
VGNVAIHRSSSHDIDFSFDRMAPSRGTWFVMLSLRNRSQP